MTTGDARALDAALHRCALADRSDLGRLLGNGPDLPGLLQRLGTGDLRGLEPGGGRETVLTTPKGRIAERVFVHALPGGKLLLVAGPGRAEAVRAHVERYTVSERAELADVSPRWAQLALVGPEARRACERAGLPVPEPLGCTAMKSAGEAVTVLGQDGSSRDGLSILVPAGRGDDFRRLLLNAVEAIGGRAAAPSVLEAWRILRGLGTSGREFTGEYHPLEAGLLDAVSFTKGCYVGQEVIARLRTYDKVVRKRVGLVLQPGATPPGAGAEVRAGERAVGAVTSALLPPGRTRPVALAYVRRDRVEAGGSVQVVAAGGPVPATVCDLPFPETD